MEKEDTYPMETRGGVLLTKKQEACVNKLSKLLKTWDKNLAINAIAGNLTVMLLGDTKQNPIPEMSDTGGFNQDNIVDDFDNNNVNADGGDW
jgi:hypothetical protein